MNIDQDTGEGDEDMKFAEPLDGSLLDVSVNEEVKETLICGHPDYDMM